MKYYITFLFPDHFAFFHILAAFIILNYWTLTLNYSAGWAQALL